MQLPGLGKISYGQLPALPRPIAKQTPLMPPAIRRMDAGSGTGAGPSKVHEELNHFAAQWLDEFFRPKVSSCPF